MKDRKHDPASSDICYDFGFYFAEYRYLCDHILFTDKCVYLTRSGYFQDHLEFSNHCTQETILFIFEILKEIPN